MAQVQTCNLRRKPGKTCQLSAFAYMTDKCCGHSEGLVIRGPYRRNARSVTARIADNAPGKS